MRSARGTWEEGTRWLSRRADGPACVRARTTGVLVGHWQTFGRAVAGPGLGFSGLLWLPAPPIPLSPPAAPPSAVYSVPDQGHANPSVPVRTVTALTQKLSVLT